MMLKYTAIAFSKTRKKEGKKNLEIRQKNMHSIKRKFVPITHEPSSVAGIDPR